MTRLCAAENGNARYELPEKRGKSGRSIDYVRACEVTAVQGHMMLNREHLKWQIGTCRCAASFGGNIVRRRRPRDRSDEHDGLTHQELPYLNVRMGRHLVERVRRIESDAISGELQKVSNRVEFVESTSFLSYDCREGTESVVCAGKSLSQDDGLPSGRHW
jgi:hypothetical protein